MAKDRLFMETTQISPSKTAAQISNLLIEVGATHVMQEADNGEVSALSFGIKVDGSDVSFRLPVNTAAIFKHLTDRLKNPSDSDEDADEWRMLKAKRIAWRIVFRWVQAQLGFIESGMVTVQEVFLPYVVTGNGQTLYQQIEANQFKMLPQVTETT